MKLDGALITIERRSLAECMDLAVVFIQEHFTAIFSTTMLFAVPSTILTWFLMADLESATLPVTLVLFASLSPFLGAVFVIAAGARVFGEEFDVPAAFRKLMTRFGVVFGYILLTRVIGTIIGCLVLPPLLLIVRYGFVAEIVYLESTPSKKVGKRMSRLMTGFFSNLLGRGFWSFILYGMLVYGLFVIVELFSTLLLGVPIVSGRMSDFGDIENELFRLITLDPLFVTVLHFLLWLVYPIIRLAWFFCYLDVRIQKEGWDVELDFRIEAQRLKSLT